MMAITSTDTDDPPTTHTGLNLFLKNALKHPLRTAAQWPSSRALGQQMVHSTLEGTTPSGGPLIEFGAGTGAITECALAWGVHEADLILIEQNPDFCAYLRDRYPTATIIETDAMTASRNLKGVEASGVISGLPLVQFPAADRLRLMLRCISNLVSEGGRFSQFTYGYGSPVILNRSSGVHVTSSRRIWLNLYPACVWTYSHTPLIGQERQDA